MACIHYRHHIDAALDGECPLDAGTTAHLKVCTGCRAYYQQQKALIDRLYTESADEGRALDVRRLAAHVTAALPEPLDNAHSPRYRWGWARLSQAAAAVIFAACGVFYLLHDSQKSEPLVTEPAAMVMQVHRVLGSTVQTDQLEQQWQRLVAGTMEQEVQGLVAEGKSVAKFLTACLPIKMTDSPDSVR